MYRILKILLFFQICIVPVLYSESIEKNFAWTNAIYSELNYIDFSQDFALKTSESNYLNFYGLTNSDSKKIIGYFKSGTNNLFSLISIPSHSKATIVLLHGYVDHSAGFGKLIVFLNNMGYTVAAFDLPGHGLSEGMKTVINRFSEYGDALADFGNFVKNNLPGPYYFIGHSTGCSAYIEYIRAYPDIFNKTIFCAPLVRAAPWNSIIFGYYTLGKLFEYPPRLFLMTSSDKEYLHFIENIDPLQVKYASIKWTKAMLDWNDSLTNMKALPIKLTILQGNEDDVVEWRYNLPFLKKIFPATRNYMITNGRHQLFNELEGIRINVFQTLLKILDEQTIPTGVTN